MFLKTTRLSFDAVTAGKVIDRCCSAIISIIIILVPIVQDLVNPELRPRNLNHSAGLIVFLNMVTLLAAMKMARIAVLKKTVKIRIKPADILIFILLVFITLNRSRVALSLFSSVNFLELLYLVLFYILLRGTDSSMLILRSIAVSGLIQAFYALLQQFEVLPGHHALFRITGAFSNPGLLGPYLVITLIVLVSLGFFFTKTDGKGYYTGFKFMDRASVRRIMPCLFIFLILLVLYIIFLTKARASWFALLLSFSLIFYDRFKHFFWNKRSVPWRSITALISLVTIYLVILGLYKFKKDSADGRWLIWKISGNMILKKPLIGVGFDNLQAHFMDEQARYFNDAPSNKEIQLAGQVSYCFNDFLQFLVENGISGTAIALMLGYSILVARADEAKKKLLIIFKVIVFSIMIVAAFSYPSQVLPIKIIFITAIAEIVNLKKKYLYQFEVDHRPRFPDLKRISLIGLTIVLVSLSFQNNQRLFRSLLRWDNAYFKYRMGDYGSAVEEYQISYEDFSQNGNFLSDFGSALLMYGDYKNAIKILHNTIPYRNDVNLQMNLGVANYYLGRFDLSEKGFRSASDMLPNRLLPRYRLAELYIYSGQLEKAKKTARSILGQQVKVRSNTTDSIKRAMGTFLTQAGEQ